MMSSISGGGGRVGGPPGPLSTPIAQDGQKKEVEQQQRQSQTPSDGFERGAATKKAPEPSGPQAPSIKLEGDQKFNEMLRQTRNDPKALSSLANTLNLTYNRFASEFQGDKTKVSTLLDQLSQAKFSQAALEQTRGEIASLRERMSVTKHRMAIQKRRLRALKQLAGRVSDTRLAEEIAFIEARVELLETGWAESFVGLGLGKVIYSPGQDDTPEHLKKVVKTQVSHTKRQQDAEALGELMSEIHPARMVSQRAARELDGKAKRVSEEVLERVRKEQKGTHGRSVQAFAALYELFEHSDNPASDE